MTFQIIITSSQSEAITRRVDGRFARGRAVPLAQIVSPAKLRSSGARRRAGLLPEKIDEERAPFRP